MNLTDVDDKTIKGANKEGLSLKEYTSRYAKAFFEDLEELDIGKADVFPKATEHIKEMANLIKILLKKDIAYKTSDGIYFNISKFKEYGKLSHTKLKALESGKRIKNDQYEKEQAQDFVLWKSWDKEDGAVFWQNELGKGRPGWHLECSAMSMKYLGNNFDIHAGGIDLVFPHHENEIAQSECSTGKKFANYWFHNEHLLVNGQKMSKSLGNFYTLRDLLSKGYGQKAIRYLLLSSHYRQQLNFTEEGVKAAQNSIHRLETFMWKIKIFESVLEKPRQDLEIKQLIEKTKKEFERAMDDDLNISAALASIFDFLRIINEKMAPEGIDKRDAKDIHKFILSVDKVLGILEKKEEKIPAEIKSLVAQREKARKEKDFGKADKLRGMLKKKGYLVEDSKEGPRIKKS